MKKNDFILMASVAAYSFLFYQQTAGVNFFIFNLLLLVLLVWRDNTLLKNRNWIFVALSCFTTSLFVLIHGNAWATTANIISLLLLSAMSFSKGSSVIIGLLHSVYSMFASIVFMILDIIERREKKQVVEEKKSNFWQRFLIFLGGFIILFILFLLYRASNPLFKDFTKDINLDFISLNWVRFTLIGLVLLYGFFYHRNIGSLFRYDTTTSGKLNADAVVNNEKGVRKFMNLETEWVSGLVLLILLNILIIFVNILDAVYLWQGRGLPAGMGFSESVHQGVGTLILSILIAISIILFMFRSEMNFHKKNGVLKFFAVLWVIQNIFMVVSTIYRNQIYISEYSLTYKRIGVYIYLALAIAGLASTSIKIIRAKSNWYLFRFNGWSFLLALVITAGFNWDSIITRYNINHSKLLDAKYLLELSNANIPELLMLDNDKKLTGKIPEDLKDEDISSEFSRSRNDFISKTNQNILDWKVYNFLNELKESGWRSWCIDKQKVYDKIFELEKAGKIPTIDLSNYSLSTIDAISSFSQLKTLILKNNFLADIADLKNFTNLESVDISGNKINSLEKLPSLKKLKEFKLSGNTVHELGALKTLTALETLDISNNGLLAFKTLPVMDKLTYLDISGDQIKDYSSLKNLKNLKTLVLMNAVNRDVSTMPKLENLTSLCVSHNNISMGDFILMNKLLNFDNLTSLDISQNNLESLRAFDVSRRSYEEQRNKPLFPALKKLNLTGDKLFMLDGIYNFPALEELTATLNNISSLDAIKDLHSLTRLIIDNNQIKDVSDLQNLTGLKTLDISGNPLTNPEIIKNLKGLDTLSANRIGLGNINFVAPLINLKELNLIGNNIISLSPLLKLTKLESLNITNNPVTDFTPLYKMKSLKYLYIPYVDSEVLSALQEHLPNTVIYENDMIMTAK